MSYELKLMYLDKTNHNLKYKYGNSVKLTEITYHQTSNSSPAINERNYLNNRTDNVYIGFHFVVDEKQAIQCLPLSVQTWHAGDGRGNGNMKSISVEIARSTNSDITLRDKAIENGAKLIAKLMKDYNIPMSKVKSHQSRSGKHCPHDILDRYGEQKFRNLIQAELNKLNGSQTSKVEVQKVQTVNVNRKVKFVKDVNIWNDTNWKSVKGQVKKGRVVYVTKMTKDYTFYVIDGGYVTVDTQFSLCSDMNKLPLKKIMPIRDCTCFTYCDGKHGIDQLKVWEVFETIDYKDGWYLVYGRGWVHESHIKCFELNKIACTNGCV